MEIKLSIILLVATVAESSSAQVISNSCSSVTKISADLATIQFGEDEARNGYVRYSAVINTEILSVLAERSGEFNSTPAESTLRTETALNQTIAAVALGLVPTFQAFKVFQPALDVSSIVSGMDTPIRNVNVNIYLAIKAAQGNDSVAAKAEILQRRNTTLANGSDLIRGLFDRILNGTTPIPDEAKNVAACIQAKAEAEVRTALLAIYDEITILAKALTNVNNKRAIRKSVSDIAVANKKATDSLTAEVSDKFSLLRNLVIDRYLKETGTVTGLFAIQSIAPQTFG